MANLQKFETGPLRQLALLPVPVFLAAMALLWVMRPEGAYELPRLMMGLNFVFSVLASLYVAYQLGRSFLFQGSPGLLVLGCGVLIWGAAGLAGIAAGGGNANSTVTIHNLCVWLSALCNFTGAIFLLRLKGAQRAANGVWLCVGYTAALCAVGLVALATDSGGLPAFFIQGHGGTLVRQMVLGSAIIMLLVSASLLQAANRSSMQPFAYWYTLALLMIAVGLFGVMIQPSSGSALGWTGRAAQLLSGVYLLAAAVASRRESRGLIISLGEVLGQAPHRYGVAVLLVIAAVAVRLAFLQMLGARAVFITFYPAVILAALYGGVRAGLLATLLSALAANFFLMEPVGQFHISSLADWVSIVVFLLSCTMISCIAEAMHRARAKLLSYQDHLEELVQARTAELEREVSERKQAEERLRMVLEASAMGTFEVDVASGQGRWNSVEYELLGLKPGEALGNPETFFRYIHPGDLELVKARWAEALRIGQLDVEFRIMHADGHERWLAGKGRFVFAGEAGGQAVRFLGVNFDITERKKAEEQNQKLMAAVQQERDRLSALINSITDEVWFADTNRNFTLTNPSALKEFGLAESATQIEVEKFAACLEVYRPDDTPRPVEEAPPLLALKGETIKSLEEIVRTPMKQELRYRLVSAAPVRDSLGNIIGSVSVVRDITDRKRMEEELKHRAAELAAANKELESFSYSLSHDLRSSLRAMSGFSSILLDKYSDSLDAKAQNYLRRINANVHSMNELIDDMLSLAKITRQKMHPQEIDLSAIAESAVSELRQAEPERHVEVVIARGLWARGDARLMRIALSNLIGNAWKYSSKTPDARIEFGAMEGQGEKIFYVRDNGAGFDMEFADKLFEPFQRLHAESQFPGTGIGLAIVRRVIQRHDGRVWAEGEAGNGATFYFVLPRGGGGATDMIETCESGTAGAA